MPLSLDVSVTMAGALVFSLEPEMNCCYFASQAVAAVYQEVVADVRDPSVRGEQDDRSQLHF